MNIYSNSSFFSLSLGCRFPERSVHLFRLDNWPLRRVQGKRLTNKKPISVTRLGDFWKFLATKFVKKVAQMIGNFLSSVEKPYSCVQNCCCYFLGNFWKHLGFFLLQHLVTLEQIQWTSVVCSCRWLLLKRQQWLR